MSSTIFDLRDLRSALKFYLEEQGCLVLASEFNDFQKELDRHSYEACLKSIENCDYYVLIIGARRGGWFDVGGKVTITQQEYRHALALHDAGRLKLMTFVRSDTWNFRETYKALARQGISDEERRKLKSTFAEDPDFTVSFIDEVSRNAETKKALTEGGALPTGNWIHTFDSFRDVVDTLRTVLPVALPMQEAAFRRSLRHELIEALRICLPRQDGGLIDIRAAVQAFLAEFTLRSQDLQSSQVALPAETWDRLSTVLIWTLGKRFPASVLSQAPSSPTFLSFDPLADGVVESDVYNAVYRLLLETNAANDALEQNVHDVILRHSARVRPGEPRDVAIDSTGLVRVLHFAQRCANIVSLARALIRHLDGDRFQPPHLLPWSPVEGGDDHIEHEKPSREEVEQFIAG
nr:DUF4062 domain-containing protein [Bradyrhizobium diazoefficiens]